MMPELSVSWIPEHLNRVAAPPPSTAQYCQISQNKRVPHLSRDLSAALSGTAASLPMQFLFSFPPPSPNIPTVLSPETAPHAT